MPHDRPTASTPRFQLAAHLDGQSLVLALAGDLDMAATFKLEPAVDRLLAEHDVRRLVFDLRDVRFIDSTGLGALLSLRDRAMQLEIEMRLVNISDPVRRLLAISGVGSVLKDAAARP